MDSSSAIIKSLMAHTTAGYCSRIIYDKGDGAPLMERVIEPRQLAEGAAGEFMVCAVQLIPESGYRKFRANKIRQAAKDDRPLSAAAKKNNKFCTGEIVTFSVSNDLPPILKLTPQTDEPAPRVSGPIWRDPWFSRYIWRVREAVCDLTIDAFDLTTIQSLQAELRLTREQIGAAHCYLLAEDMLGMASDGYISVVDEGYILKLTQCLSQLGYSPFDR